MKRFEEKTKINETTPILNGHHCTEWTGATNNCGYGFFRFNGKNNQLAHRVAHILYKGDIPEGHVVDHLCHNHACVEPAHLEAKTKKANSARHKKHNKLTFDVVREIRVSGLSIREVAKKYNILRICAKRILEYKTYKKAV